MNWKWVLFLLAACGLILFGFSKFYRSSPSEQVATTGTSSNEDLSLSKIKEFKSELDKAYGDSDIQTHSNDSNGKFSDVEYNSALNVVNAYLPILLDDKQIIKTTAECKVLHQSYSNKVMVLFEAIIFNIDKKISGGNDLGLNSCSSSYKANNIDSSSRRILADLSYQLIIQNCFVDGVNQEKKLQKLLEPVQHTSDCSSAKKYETFVNNIIMQPRFKTKFSQ